MGQSEFSVAGATGNSNASVTVKSAVPFFPASPQSLLVYFSSLQSHRAVRFRLASPLDYPERGCWQSSDITSIALFISYMTAKTFAHSTICSHISALSYINYVVSPTLPNLFFFLISKLLTAHRRANPVLDVRLPITRPVLHNLVRSLDFTSQGQPGVFGIWNL